uniref:PREDICTED: similar to retrotransposon protein putati n=1 Tax=Albugo laibachii Nc14 TaxID=890382 RepID=F0W6M8_9STRA|nr:PREDICTED: similar to retrotransposon protein putati [Albugo laibachii Nc14]|eukprot:CCA16773.1 PREDICTED: similar to retrotransposon protein putati [Albugo laibachii Nc14]
MEAEFTSASHSGQELLGLREIIVELGINVELPMQIEIDNQAAIHQMENEESSTRAKHIDIKLKFIKECAKRVIVKPCYVHSEEMAADLLTKAFSAVRLQQLMGICSLIRETSKNQDIKLGNKHTAP